MNIDNSKSFEEAQNTSNDQDIFSNLDTLKISQDFSEEKIIKKILTEIQTKKPDKQQFIRSHSKWVISALIINLKEKGETYFIHPSLISELSDEAIQVKLFTSITLQGELFIWPVPYPSDNQWHKSALEAAQFAINKWIRVRSNQSQNRYQIYEPVDNFPEPEWPDITFNEILRIAFKNRTIESVDHPVVKNLRGIR
ncbi:MAG: hypothetical protein V1874_08785 [Spirochaetota bacterium]